MECCNVRRSRETVEHSKYGAASSEPWPYYYGNDTSETNGYWDKVVDEVLKGTPQESARLKMVASTESSAFQ